MGFVYDTPITTDADFFKYAGEQQLDNLLVNGKTDWSDLHAGAVNALIRSLKAQGYDPSLITNTNDFKPELVYWVLARVWASEALAGREGAAEKAEFYHKLWQEEVRTRIVIDATDRKAAKALPGSMHVDRGPWFGPDLNAREDVDSNLPGFDGGIRNFGS